MMEDYNSVYLRSRKPLKPSTLLNRYAFIMLSTEPIDLDDASDTSSLTTAISGETPTLPSAENPSVRALLEAKTDRAFDEALSRIPRENRIKIRDVLYVKYAPYRSKKSTRQAWYWDKSLAEELIRVTKGNYLSPIFAFLLTLLGTNHHGQDLRCRKIWHCAHCDETQYAEANCRNKESHLLKAHRISKHGNKVPQQPLDRYIKRDGTNATPPLRQSEAYVNLTTSVMRDPFTDALITFLVICQMALSLVANEVFLEFLEQLYPTIRKILPHSSHTIREYIINAFKARKQKLKESLAMSQSKISFSFDLWTSPNHMALLGIIGHYIGEHGQKQSVSAISLVGWLQYTPFSLVDISHFPHHTCWSHKRYGVLNP
jgi:hypothetical protein